MTQLEALYRPEARATMRQQVAERDDPMGHCVPPPFPYAAVWGTPFQIVQTPGFAYVLTEGFATFRIVPTNGRPHTDPDYLYPVYMGDSTAHWEDDTLVVDVISFNGSGWLASGRDKPTAGSTGVWPTSPTMHVVERWRRLDAETLEYQARVEDPSMLTSAWDTPTIVLKRQPVKKIQEALCLLGDEAKYPDQWRR